MSVVGYGVVARTNFEKGSFLLDYVGELLTVQEANERTSRDYLYKFSLQQETYE